MVITAPKKHKALMLAKQILVRKSLLSSKDKSRLRALTTS